MPKAELPHSSESVISDTNSFTATWNRFFEQLKARIGADKSYSLGGVLTTSTTAVGNITGGEDNLITYSLQKNTLQNIGDTLEIIAYGTTAANANAKTIKLIIGSTTLFTTGAVAFNNKDWCLRCTLIRTAAATQQAITTFQGDFALLTNTADFVTGTEDFTTSLTIKCTGTSGGSATDDIIQKGLVIKLFPI
jgi:hypothetical protein